MESSLEATVLRLLEQAMEVDAARRETWLQELDADPGVVERLRRLLADATVAESFLTAPPTLSADAPVLPAVGDRLGAWRLQRELGSGGMGVVYLVARDDGTYEQAAALKLMRGEFLLLDREQRGALSARFDNERRLLARLLHPNVARIFDGGSTAAGVPWLVMEFVDGLPLTDYCEHHRLDVAARLALFCKLCDGVQAAHRHLIVHRDLKPGNVLVGMDGEPKLLDFGIARALDPATSGNATRTGAPAMTPAYASPEQVRMQPLTTASDVYSLGVVLYELLTDARPYVLDGLSPVQSEKVVCESQPDTLRHALASGELPESERHARQSRIGGDLERIVAKAMHKEPERRYGSAQALADDLRRHLAGQPVQAHPDSVGYRAARFVARHRIGTAAAALALVAIVAAAGAALLQARQARQAADDMRRVNAFLMDVLQLSDPFDTGQQLTLAQALDGAAESLDQHFPGRPDLSSGIRFGVGYSMLSRYRLDAAQDQLTRARVESEAAFGKDDIRSLRVVEGLAGLRQEQGRNDEAEALFLEGIARIEQAGLTTDPLYVDFLNNLGNLYLTREKYAEADRWFRRAAAHIDTSAASPDSAALVSNLAQAAHGLGDHARADSLYRKAQSQLEEHFTDGSPDLAIVLNNRALLASDRGLPQEALELHRQSLAMRRRVFKGDHPMIVVALTAVAHDSLQLGDAGMALSHAVEAAAMADRVYTDPNSRHVSAYATLALARQATGDVDGARLALARARVLLATVKMPASEVPRQVAQARQAICGTSRIGTGCMPDARPD